MAKLKMTFSADKFEEKFANQVARNMDAIAEEYRQDVRQKLNTPPPRTGKIYHNIKGKKTHQASAPGEPPAPLSHALRTNISIQSSSASGFEGRDVIPESPYAASLEHGTAKIKPRPAWFVTLAENAEKYRKMAFRGIIKEDA